MNDIEFVANYNLELKNIYVQAKDYVHDVPIQALINIRIFCFKFTEIIGKKKGITYATLNIYSRIEQLNQDRIISAKTVRILHQLRIFGNQGAHPEKYHLSYSKLESLAKNAIAECIELLKIITNQEKMHIEFIDYNLKASHALCYAAIMDNDPKSQYLVGKNLKSKALLSEKPISLLKQAMYWFEQASESNIDAKYEYGVALINGYNGEKKPQGELIIAEAAKQGVIEAIALLGFFYLTGTSNFEKNLDKAKRLLLDAANKDELEAVANLGVLFYEEGNLDLAKKYIYQAAVAGYPPAQYHLGLLQEKEEDLKNANYWFKKAAKQNYVDAMVKVAQIILNTKGSLNEARQYLEESIKFGSIPAMIELSIGLADGSFGNIDLKSAVAIIKNSNGHTKTEKEAFALALLRDKLIIMVEELMQRKNDEKESFYLNDLLDTLVKIEDFYD